MRETMPCLSVMESSETGDELNLVSKFASAGDLEHRGRIGSGLNRDFDPPSPADSSSIGVNSDEEREEEGEDEVQGPLRGGFNASLDSLEEALPMRRGISSFYNGKSKSFTSLADASSSPSVNAIVKPETPYSRKRRNLLSYALLSENHHHHRTMRASHLNKTHGGISKKPASLASSSSSGRATLALALAMANSNTNTSPNKANNATSVMGGLSRVGGNDDPVSSPLSLRSFCHWRSFSLVDLQQCQPVVSSKLRSLDDVS